MLARLNGESIYYEVDGDGPPLVLMHGWTLNLRMWDPQVTGLAQRFRMIRFDRRGFGRSSGHEDVRWDAADLDALLTHLDVSQAHILGMSQGGSVALRFARRYSARASSLILHGSIPPDGFPLAWNGRDRVPVDVWQKVAQAEGMERFREEMAAHPVLHVPDSHPAVRRQLREMLAAYPGSRLLDPVAASGPIAPATMDDLRHLTLPALVLIGDSDVPYLQIVARALAYYLPHAEFAVIRGGGHMVNMTQPEAYNAALARFLDRTGRV